MSGHKHALLKVGDTSATGQKVALILGGSRKACVFTTEDNNLRWEYYLDDGNLSASATVVVGRFDELTWQIANFLPKSCRVRFYHRLGQALFTALDSEQVPEEALRYFQPLEANIKEAKLGMAYYVVSGVGTFVAFCILGGIMVGSTTIVPDAYITGTVCGAAGALASMLQRAGKLDVLPESIKLMLVLQGAARIIVGAIFGAFLILASHGDLVVGFVGGKETTSLALAFIAGISERFVPEITQAVQLRAQKEKE